MDTLHEQPRYLDDKAHCDRDAVIDTDAPPASLPCQGHDFSGKNPGTLVSVIALPHIEVARFFGEGGVFVESSQDFQRFHGPDAFLASGTVHDRPRIFLVPS